MVSEKVPPVISDKPHQFWQSLDAWCSEITLEDVERLQELLKSQDNDDEYFKVPALGVCVYVCVYMCFCVSFCLCAFIFDYLYASFLQLFRIHNMPFLYPWMYT